MSELSKLDAEAWLAKRLKDHGADVFDGVTDPASREERMRQAIVQHGLAAVVIGRRDKKPETYSQCFERLYGRPLTVPRGTNKSGAT